MAAQKNGLLNAPYIKAHVYLYNVHSKERIDLFETPEKADQPSYTAAGIVCINESQSQSEYIVACCNNTYGQKNFKVFSVKLSNTNSPVSVTTYNVIEGTKGSNDQSINLVLGKNGKVYAITAVNENGYNKFRLFRMEFSGMDVRINPCGERILPINLKSSNSLTANAAVGISIWNNSIIVHLTDIPHSMSHGLKIAYGAHSVFHYEDKEVMEKLGPESSAKHMFAYDYDHSGKMDHIFLYSPGKQAVKIIKFKNGKEIELVYDGNGIGGFDVRSINDRAFAFDYEHSGKMDHIVLYRPGSGVIYILKHKADNTFEPVYQTGPSGGGIGGYDLRSVHDRAFAFDYDHSGKMDHIVLYRPESGVIYILKHKADNTFEPVYQTGPNGGGIGGYDLRSKYDRAFAFDYDHSGKMDHIVLYRPGERTIFIIKHKAGNTFEPVYQTDAYNERKFGIGEYDLNAYCDRAFAFDYNHSGKMDHIVLYRKGSAAFYILKHKSENQFETVYITNPNGPQGILEVDQRILREDDGYVFPIDYSHCGTLGDLVFCKEGFITPFYVVQYNN